MFINRAKALNQAAKVAFSDGYLKHSLVAVVYHGVFRWRLLFRRALIIRLHINVHMKLTSTFPMPDGKVTFAPDIIA